MTCDPSTYTMDYPSVFFVKYQKEDLLVHKGLYVCNVQLLNETLVYSHSKLYPKGVFQNISCVPVIHQFHI